MVSFNPVSTPVLNPTPNREQAPLRDDTASRERLQSTKPSGASLAKTDTTSDKNYRQARDFSANDQSEQSYTQGNRRGSLLDLTV